MFYPMEEQASHTTNLLEENRRYIKDHGKVKKNSNSNHHHHHHNNSSSSRPSMQQFLSTDTYSSSEYSSGNTTDYSSDPTSGIQDRMVALQLENTELNVCLEREKRRRKEAEERVERDEGYIKRLEDCVQTLRGTRVVMDPTTYRQLAEAYVAARRPPVRRPHTHAHGPHPSDLVCDAPLHPIMNHPRLSHPLYSETSSCPSSPKSSSSSSSSTSSASDDSQVFTRGGGRGRKEQGTGGGSTGGGGGGGGGVMGLGAAGSMNPWEYQQLLDSLENMDVASRGALS